MNNTNGVIRIYFSCLVAAWLLFGTHQIAGAQPLDALLKGTRSSNLEIQALKREYMAEREVGPQVSQLPDPELGVGVFVMPIETRLGPQRWRFGISQMFPWPGRLAEQRKLALARAEVTFDQIAVEQLEVGYQIREAYYELYELKQTEELIQQNLRLLRTLERLSLGRVESGKGDLVDVVNVQLQVREWEQQLELLQVRRIDPLARLNRLLNRPLDTEVNVVDTLLLAPLPDTLDQWVARLGTDHPQAQRLQSQIEVAEQSLQVNALEAKPDIGVSLDYAILGRRTDADPVGNGQNMLMPSFMFRLPLYREKYRAKEREENLRILALNDRRQDVANRLAGNILQAMARHREAVLLYELANTQIQSLRRMLDLLLSTYSADGRQFEELLQVHRSLLMYETQRLQAVVQSHLAVAALQR